MSLGVESMGLGRKTWNIFSLLWDRGHLSGGELSRVWKVVVGWGGFYLGKKDGIEYSEETGPVRHWDGTGGLCQLGEKADHELRCSQSLQIPGNEQLALVRSLTKKLVLVYTH